jgi:hypothetical protein
MNDTRKHGTRPKTEAGGNGEQVVRLRVTMAPVRSGVGKEILMADEKKQPFRC